MDISGFCNILEGVANDNNGKNENQKNQDNQNTSKEERNKQSATREEILKIAEEEFNKTSNRDATSVKIANFAGQFDGFADRTAYVKEKTASKSVPSNSGHRQRARDRFLLNPEGTSDQDLMELLLFLILPRVDTKPLAKTLLNHFKTIRNIFLAPKEEFNKCGANGDAIKYLYTLINVFQKRLFLQNHNEEATILNDIDKLFEYCRNSIGLKTEEEFHILFFNNGFKLLKDRAIGTCSVANVSISNREITKNALDLSANKVILYHNHPSGDLTPSQNDIITTETIADMLKCIDVEVIDHLIITAESYYSFKENNLMKFMNNSYQSC